MTDTRTIAVDFDGVIHRYSRGWQDGSIYDGPNPGAIAGLRALMGHYAVFVHTSRDPYPVAQWLDRYDIPAFVEMETDGERHKFWNDRDKILVTNRKLPAWRYVDDRALLFTSWGQTLRDLLPDEVRAVLTERAEKALIEAYPDLDGVFAEQAVQVVLGVIDRGGEVSTR